MRAAPLLALAGVLLLGSGGAATAWGDTCGDDFLRISQVQGTGASSPVAGRKVAVEGLVTGNFLGRDRLSGFYLMSAPADADTRPDTSEGLFVHVPAPVTVATAPGTRVRVRGRVREYHGLTELTNVTAITTCEDGSGLPEARALRWPMQQPESLEGMLVAAGPLAVVGQRELERYGSLRLAPERLRIPTQLLPPGPAAEARARANRERSIVLDDGSTQTRPDQTYALSPKALDRTGQAARPLRLGDQTGPFRAILDFRFGEWRLQPVEEVALAPANPRPAPLPEPRGLRLAAINLGNFFNGDGRGEGFPTARGAADHAGYRRQKAGLVATLHALDADVIALAEIENDGYGRNSAVADLAGGLGADWTFVDFGRPAGTDAIANGILYDSARLTLVGAPAVLDTRAFARGNRPALAASFRTAEEARPLTIVANHFKSKRCQGADGVQADQADGQSCWAALRTRAAQELVSWLETDPTATGGSLSFIMGDLNSYRAENSLQVLARAGFVNPLAPEHYSYSYKGEVGTLDYILVPAVLEPAVIQAGTWAANVDETAGTNQPRPVEGEPWRASDHDPVWLDLEWPLP